MNDYLGSPRARLMQPYKPDYPKNKPFVHSLVGGFKRPKMPPKKKRKVKQKTKVSAKTKEVLKELGETTNGQDAKTAAMSLLGVGVARTQRRYLFRVATWYAMHVEHP